MKGDIIPLLIIIFLSMPQTHNAHPTNNTLTDELIHKICSKTIMKPSLCQKVLEPSKGNITLSSLSSAVARYSMKTTYHTLGLNNRFVRATKCMAECMLLTGEYAKCFKKWIEIALKRASAKCGKPYKRKMNIMKQGSVDIREANEVFLDFCRVVLDVCKEMKCQSKVN